MFLEELKNEENEYDLYENDHHSLNDHRKPHHHKQNSRQEVNRNLNHHYSGTDPRYVQ
jgi:hypothetical protein